MVEQGRLEVGQERRRLGLADRAAPGPPAGVAQEQVRAGPGHADEEQPPLLGGLLGRRLGAEAQRQQPVLAADQEHHRELQALGGVQGEQRHPVGPRVPGVDLVAEGQLGQEPVQVVAAARGQRGEQLQRLGRLAPAVGRGARPGGPPASAAGPRSPAGPAGEPGSRRARTRARTAGRSPQPVVRALLERHAGPAQRLGQRPRLGVGAVEHGDVGERQAVLGPAVGPARVQRQERGAAQQPVDRTGPRTRPRPGRWPPGGW